VALEWFIGVLTEQCQSWFFAETFRSFVLQ